MLEQPAGLAPWQAVDTLLAIEEEEALETALAAAETPVAAAAVSAAPSLERKTTLLWAMEDRQRRDVLEMVPPALVGALVQNLEDDNRYLLGDLSLEQFRALLQLCSPERKYYWVTTALSFTDARANALPLLLTTGELVEIFLTRAEFEEHLRAMSDYPIEDARLPAELMRDPAQTLVDVLGPEHLLRHFPIAETGLAHVLQTILDYDPDRYVDILKEGLRLSDYGENHPLEWDALVEDPVLLDSLPRPDRIEAPAVELEAGEEEPRGETGPPLALVPMGAPPLVRLAAGLPPAQLARMTAEMQYLYIRQAVAEGGSFHRSDLERVARRVEAYLLLGLQAESGRDPAAEAKVLANRPLHKVSQNGARVVESLRQVALRLRPLEKVLSPDQRVVVRSLAAPRLTVNAEGQPRIILLPAAELPEDVDVDTAAVLLRDIGAWTAVARELGLEKTEKALGAAGSVEALLEELVLEAVLYSRMELGLAEAADRARFASRYLSRVGQHPLPEARAGVRRAVEAWEGRVDPQLVLPLLDRSLDRLAERLAGDA